MLNAFHTFIRMLPVFFARVRPASHKAKPACIKYTRNAATSTQMTVDELYIFKPLLSRSNHGASSIFSCRIKPGQYRIILSADTASEVRQMLNQKRR